MNEVNEMEVISCIECDTNIENCVGDPNDILLCEKCNTMICKTNVKNIYGLTDKDIIDLPVVRAPNRQYRHSGDLYLYRKNDVYLLCHEKYGDVSNSMSEIIKYIENKKNKKIIDNEIKKNKKIIDMENKRKIMVQSRKNELVKALSKVGLELRSDSSLCHGWINNSITDYRGRIDDSWTIDSVVHRMCQMRYLFDYCDMDECLSAAYKEQQEEIRQGYYPDSSVFDSAEYMALKNKGYPLIFPWLAENSSLKSITFADIENQSYNTCPISNELLLPDTLIIKLNCSHYFTKSHLETWLTKYKRTCPLCRSCV